MNSYQLQKGYKQTEVGVIPEDWDLSCLDLVSKLSSGTTPARAQGNRYYRNGKYYWVKTTDLNNSLITSTEEKITQAALDETCLQIYPPGTVFVAMYGGFNQIGRTGMLKIPAAVNQALIAIQTKSNKLDPVYLLTNLNYRVEHWKSVASSSRKDPNITSQDVRNFIVPLPPLPEQRSIATALSDMDELLGGLDRLITKKRDLKQSATQQLLTGEVRLLGFGQGKSYKQTEVGLIPEDWVLTPLSKVSAFITKGSTPTTYGFNWTQNGIIFLRSECVAENGLDLSQSMFISKQAHSTLKRSELRSGDLLITITGNVGRVVHLKENFSVGNMNQHIARVRITDDSACAKFIYHYLSQSTIRKAFNAITTGQAYPQISLKQVRDAVVPLPSIEEQNAIASILSDMDTEIATLEQRRHKTQELKQAMMQELLTGRIRLVQ